MKNYFVSGVYKEYSDEGCLEDCHFSHIQSAENILDAVDKSCRELFCMQEHILEIHVSEFKEGS